MSLDVAQLTNAGLDPAKQLNEDAAAHGLTPIGHLLVVCDGMGGHALGREASQLALATISKLLQGTPATSPPGPALARAIGEAGRAVYQLGGQKPNPARPGSTCVAVLVHGTTADVAHVGDSRAFLVRRGQAWQLTKDHSVVQELIDRGMLTPEQAGAHPEANKITRALGMKLDTEVELREPPIACGPDDVFVLATDGLCDLVTADEIAAVLGRAASLEGACDELIRIANARGGHDNITVQLARVLPLASPSPGGGSAPLPAATLPAQILAPTIVEAPGGLEKTVIDPNPVVASSALGSGEVAQPARYHAPARRFRPDTTARLRGPWRGWLVLGVAFLGITLIVGGVILFWVLRGSR